MVLLGSCSLPGTRYGHLNQDHVIIEELHNHKDLKKNRWSHQLYCALVLDGHGMLGEVAAQEAGQAILRYLRTSALKLKQLKDFSQEEIQGLMEQAFAVGHKFILRLYNQPPPVYEYPKGASNQASYSLGADDEPDHHPVYRHPDGNERLLEFGTTVTLACVQGDTLVVANVGDSNAVLGKDEQGGYNGQVISKRHCGGEPEEVERLEADWGSLVHVNEEDGYVTVEAEGRLKGVQIAMTRALGHKLLSDFGVITTPSVTMRQLRPEDLCLIVASDGVWEVMSPGEAVRTVCDSVAEGRTLEWATNTLCAEAVRIGCDRRRSSGEADNTTAAVLVFDDVYWEP